MPSSCKDLLFLVSVGYSLRAKSRSLQDDGSFPWAHYWDFNLPARLLLPLYLELDGVARFAFFDAGP